MTITLDQVNYPDPVLENLAVATWLNSVLGKRFAAHVLTDTSGNEIAVGTKLDTLHADLAALAGYLDGLEGYTDGIETALASILAKIIASPATEATLAAQSAKLPASLGQKAATTSLAVVPASSGFDIVVAPTVTNGAYSAGDIMGALMTFTLTGLANDEPFMLNELQFSFKSAVTPSLLAVILSADPTATTKTDNAVYSLAAADVFKVRAALPVNSLGGYLTDHGTPNTIRLPAINLVMNPVSGTNTFYMLLVDLTGVTLTSTSDLQVRASGMAMR